MKMLLRFFISLYVIPKNIILYYWVNTKSQSNVVSELHKYGAYIFKDRLTQEELEGLINDYNSLIVNVKIAQHGQLKGRVYTVGALSSLVSQYVDRFKPIAAEYFNNKNIDCELSMYQKSLPEMDNDNIPGGEFHMDDNKKNLKFFIYLTDVTIFNGPFIYVKKSHGLSNIKKLYKWWLWEITSSRKYLYTGKCEQQAMLRAGTPILGGSGTIFCGDTTGYHAASVVEEGERLVMVISFAETRLNPYYLNSKAY